MQEPNSFEIETFASEPMSQPSPYDLLIRQSKKMGAVATRAFGGVRGLLYKELQEPAAATSNLIDNLSIVKHDKSLQEAKNLRKIVKKSSQVLAAVRTVFPMTIFPHSIVVDRSKITIIKRDFFWTSRVISIQIEDILNVESGIGPFFGSLTIASRVMSSVDHFQINYFWRGDAIFLKHLIQGYVIAKHNKIDTSELTPEEMIETLTDLGEDSDR
jgi:hypothetical protein